MNTNKLESYSSLTSYQEITRRLRRFFFARNFVEIDVQSRLSILAACEDPKTIAEFTLSGVKWPLPQTGQMWLEHEILKNPEAPGFFCLTTSYRDEPKVDSTRHLKIFPLFEFETHGDMSVLQKLMVDLLEYLEMGDRSSYCFEDYATIANQYLAREIASEHEMQMARDFSPVCFLRNFPLHTHPFFNMKRVGDVCSKIDVILHGIETMGTAERSTNIDEMREMFHSISDGEYAGLLYKHFGKERVNRELEEFLSLDFFPRCGGGIGLHRLVRAIEIEKQANVSIQKGYQPSVTI